MTRRAFLLVIVCLLIGCKRLPKHSIETAASEFDEFNIDRCLNSKIPGGVLYYGYRGEYHYFRIVGSLYGSWWVRIKRADLDIESRGILAFPYKTKRPVPYSLLASIEKRRPQ